MSVAETAARRLYVLDFGLFRVHDDGRTIGIQGYLLQLSTGETVLVDSGFPPWYVEDTRAAMTADGVDRFGELLELAREHEPGAQLARAGVRPGDVTHFVLTHSDIDHIGGAAEFEAATLVVGRAERALARPRYFGDRSPLDWPTNARVHLVDADTELWPGVMVLSTPGHSPGHLSLLVDLPSTGAVLITADAVSRPSQLVDGFTDAWDAAQARRQAARIIAIARQRRAFVIFGHDPAQWPTLRKAPSFYD